MENGGVFAKNIIFTVLFVFFATASVYCRNDLSIEVSLDKKEYRPGEKITASIAIKNISGRPIKLPLQIKLRYLFLDFKIWGEKAGTVHFTGPKIKFKYLNRCFMLRPGDVFSSYFDLSPNYHLKVPGNYWIECSYRITKDFFEIFSPDFRHGFKGCWTGGIKSKPVKFIVVSK